MQKDRGNHKTSLFEFEALFVELRANVEDDPGRLGPARQSGGETPDVVLELLEKLDDYRAKSP